MSDVPPDPLPAPYHDLFGFRLLDWRDGFARLAAEAGPQHMNRAGVVHGGFVLGLIDQAAAYSGLWCSVPGNARRGLTLALAAQFIAPVTPGPVVAEARVVGRGGTTFFTRTEVFRADGTLVATGQGTHRWRSGSERVEGMPVAQMTGA
ncbi:PaaI family thioesterase [Elioraea sp.]|jgi:uncharacterized protein (TIGR00369 family)|uniref:PaaI family thioesterase n=1 Tax=Elioraea sp. TaxID=2185103 RepID=UPI0021DE6E33|nr:PaaI family thioesterase [Elioraea sp.]GIX08655.1 MAG: hypothetical protein KatS3mg116_0365 [Elioraea sp.]